MAKMKIKVHEATKSDKTSERNFTDAEKSAFTTYLEKKGVKPTLWDDVVRFDYGWGDTIFLTALNDGFKIGITPDYEYKWVIPQLSLNEYGVMWDRDGAELVTFVLDRLFKLLDARKASVDAVMELGHLR